MNDSCGLLNLNLLNHLNYFNYFNLLCFLVLELLQDLILGRFKLQELLLGRFKGIDDFVVQSEQEKFAQPNDFIWSTHDGL